MTNAVSLHEVGFTYNPSKRNEKAVFSEVGLSIDEGDVLGLIGPSGSGKTTLLGVMSGLLGPSHGVVRICGQSVGELSQAERTQVRRKHCSFVTQGGDLDPHLTVLQNVMLTPLFCKGVRVTNEAADHTLASVGIERGLYRSLPGTLSGGERQRVAIAAALACKPKVMFLDEPTSALDGPTKQQVLGVLMDSRDPKTSIVIVSHDMGVVESICTLAVRMQDGVLTHV